MLGLHRPPSGRNLPIQPLKKRTPPTALFDKLGFAASANLPMTALEARKALRRYGFGITDEWLAD